MARIRTIKPEFPQSESMGRVGRDARLCFIMLWTISDDAGRLRGNSRMLASLLFPYDDDAKLLINGWLQELEREHCVTRYEVDGDAYLQINEWAKHQKIDRPSESKIPGPSGPVIDDSRGLARTREDSPLDQGRDQGEEGKGGAVTALFRPPAGKPDDCPHQAIIEIWHEVLPEARRIRDWTPARQEHLRARWREDEKRRNLDWWRKLFEYIRTCPFLMGQKASPGRKPFDLSLPWLLNPENFAKVREGAYDEKVNSA